MFKKLFSRFSNKEEKEIKNSIDTNNDEYDDEEYIDFLDDLKEIFGVSSKMILGAATVAGVVFLPNITLPILLGYGIYKYDEYHKRQLESIKVNKKEEKIIKFKTKREKQKELKQLKRKRKLVYLAKNILPKVTTVSKALAIVGCISVVFSAPLVIVALGNLGIYALCGKLEEKAKKEQVLIDDKIERTEKAKIKTDKKEENNDNNKEKIKDNNKTEENKTTNTRINNDKQPLQTKTDNNQDKSKKTKTIIDNQKNNTHKNKHNNINNTNTKDKRFNNPTYEEAIDLYLDSLALDNNHVDASKILRK